MRDRDVFLVEVKERLLQAQALIKTAHNKVNCQVEVTVGDWVSLRLNQCMASTVRDMTKSKLSPKFFRPYAIIDRIGSVAYHLQLPTKARIHDIFRVAFLKKFEGTLPMAALLLPPIVRGWAMCLSRRWWCALDSHKTHGMSWSNGKGIQQLMPLGSHYNNSRRSTRTSSSGTSCFADREEVLWTSSLVSSTTAGRRSPHQWRSSLVAKLHH
jgi:hypothetical protein